MGWLDRIRQGAKVVELLGRAIEGARDLAHARELLSSAAQRGDLDVALERVLAGQSRARRYERTGR